MRKILLVISVIILNVLWINVISITNDLAKHYNIVIKTKTRTTLNNNVIIDDIDVMLENNLSYENIDAVTIGNKINNYLKADLSGYGELIAKYSIVNNVNPYLISAMIIEFANCENECSVLVSKCHNVGKMYYNKDSITEKACFGGYYQSFDTIDESIKSYIKYIKSNFYEKELTTPGTIYNSYGKDVRWAYRVNKYMEDIKNS